MILVLGDKLVMKFVCKPLEYLLRGIAYPIRQRFSSLSAWREMRRRRRKKEKKRRELCLAGYFLQ